ncbi:hypothetical protein [Embleya sp. NBC_00896]|uniref:hypothetical protein n=1 Tax=Embleya sp. NBC_00896 TaxID=2975961 RepID=UPI002F906C79|nr:hypothetical protein OG928_47095 [Embleya sp. NBC_00896]
MATANSTDATTTEWPFEQAEHAHATMPTYTDTTHSLQPARTICDNSCNFHSPRHIGLDFRQAIKKGNTRISLRSKNFEIPISPNILHASKSCLDAYKFTPRIPLGTMKNIITRVPEICDA